MSMGSVRLFDNISYAGQPWQIVAQDGPALVLQQLVTGARRHITVAQALADADPAPDLPDRLPSLSTAAVLETIPINARDHAQLLHRHVVELLTGLAPGLDSAEHPPRPEYDPALPQRDRVAAKVAELAALGTPISERTLRRYISQFRAQGLAGLVDQRYLATRSPVGRIDADVVELIKQEITKQTYRSTGTQSRLIADVSRQARALGLAVPHPTTLWRAIKNLESSTHTFGSAMTRRTQANKPDRQWGNQAPSRPGQLVEIDSTPLDLLVAFPDGSTGRVELTVVFDVATRSICSAILRPVATKSIDAAVALARAMTRLDQQPGWAAMVAFARTLLPAASVAPDEELRAAIAATPVIVPESITVDRGKVFVGSTFLNACERLEISVIKAAPRTPTDKPHVERVFAAINSGFTQYLLGYLGQNVAKRGTSVESEAYWTMSEAQMLLDLWVILAWQNRPHSGLRHPAMPRRELCPNEAFAAMATVAPATTPCLSRDDYIGLLPVDYRSIQDYGINFEGLIYHSDQLRCYSRQKSGLPCPADGRWEIRSDPYRMQSIYVRDHHRGCWIEAEWTLAKRTLAPFSRDVLAAARRIIAQRGGQDTGIDILGEINRIQTQPSRRLNERKAARRDSVNTPIIDAGPTSTARTRRARPMKALPTPKHSDPTSTSPTQIPAHLAPAAQPPRTPVPARRIDEI
ncbi:Mu transposase C-terminal domain-containing protein [Nocardia salmonicida]|uniref:Mu transposase C-terminal domain-containing protein n=1 Tax=Nocardia salmonicida TaxID=53431 RepID=UPI0037AF1858